MDQVELDGHVMNVWADFGDGVVARPTLTAIVDRASSKKLRWHVGFSENAEDTVDVYLDVCKTYGIPDLLVPDNGSAFNSRRFAGGLKPTYRTKGTSSEKWDIPGALKIMGTRLQNCAPGNPQAKLPESSFSALHDIDKAPEFVGAHTGSAPGERPDVESYRCRSSLSERS